MQPILTIALPTYNRERLLERQLEWLSRAIKGYESRIELVISDNCSTDGTPEVIRKWKPAFANVSLRLHRHPTNVGAVGNVITYCMNAPRTPYVWVISDDDPIDSEAIPFILNTIDQNPDIATIVLNFSSRDVRTGRLNFERCYDVQEEKVYPDGRMLFGELLYQNNGGVTLTTALVYRSDLARRAIAAWPEGVENLAVQMYITGYAAAHGAAMVTRRTYLECAAGDHYFMSDPRLHYKIHNVDVPRVYAKFLEIGYPRSIFMRIFWKRVKRNAHPRDWPGFARRFAVMVGRMFSTRVRRLFYRRDPETVSNRELHPLPPRP